MPDLFIARPATLLKKWELLQAIILDLAEYRTGRSQTGSTIAVLARLLDHHNSQTGLCCPSLATVARAVGISKRQASRCVDLLVERGWISKQRRRDQSTLYAFNWGRIGANDRTTDVRDERATDVRDRATDVRDSATDVNGRATDVHLNLESNPGTKTGNLTLPGNEGEQPPLDSKTGDQHPITDIAQADPSDIGNRITSPTDMDQAFAQFWQHYPATSRAEPPHVVRPAFIKAVEAGTDINVLITAATRYAAARDGKDPQYTMAMSNWLKRRSWQGTDKLPDRVSTPTIKPYHQAILDELGLLNGQGGKHR